VSAVRGQGAASGSRAQGVRDAVAAVEYVGGRSGGCASEIGKFEDNGRSGHAEGWSSEARAKVNSLVVRLTFYFGFAE
jgi:hypothetical protein